MFLVTSSHRQFGHFNTNLRNCNNFRGLLFYKTDANYGYTELIYVTQHNTTYTYDENIFPPICWRPHIHSHLLFLIGSWDVSAIDATSTLTPILVSIIVSSSPLQNLRHTPIVDGIGFSVLQFVLGLTFIPSSLTTSSHRPFGPFQFCNCTIFRGPPPFYN